MVLVPRPLVTYSLIFTPNSPRPITSSMTNSELSNKQVKFLKAQAHALKPVVRVGQHGLTAAVFKELEIALDHHELVKVKVAAEDREAREAMLSSLAGKTRAQVVQTIGGMVVLFRQNAKKPVIDLSKAT